MGLVRFLPSTRRLSSAILPWDKVTDYAKASVHPHTVHPPLTYLRLSIPDRAPLIKERSSARPCPRWRPRTTTVILCPYRRSSSRANKTDLSNTQRYISINSRPRHRLSTLANREALVSNPRNPTSITRAPIVPVFRRLRRRKNLRDFIAKPTPR